MRYQVLTSPMFGGRRVVDSTTGTVVAYIDGHADTRLTGVAVDADALGHDVQECARDGLRVKGVILTDLFLKVRPATLVDPDEVEAAAWVVRRRTVNARIRRKMEDEFTGLSQRRLAEDDQ